MNHASFHNGAGTSQPTFTLPPGTAINRSRSSAWALCRCAAALVATIFASPARAEGPTGEIRSAFVRGTQLFVKGNNGKLVSGKDLVGAVIIGIGPDGKQEQYKILGVEKDADDPTGEIELYTFHMRDPISGEWKDPCPPGPKGPAKGFPIEGTWDERGGHLRSDRFSITCAHAPMGKCIRWGYKYWKKGPGDTPLWDYYQACYRMTRADYCGNGITHTSDGRSIDLFDRIGLNREDPSIKLEFEAAWGPDGALCVAHTRIPRWTFEDIAKECPEKLKGKLGDKASCNFQKMRKDKRALVFNKS
jgi:hypothetical protein